MPANKSWVRSLDETLRFLDLRLHRTYGGYLKRFGIERESPGFLVLPALVCFVMVAGAGTLDFRLVYAAVVALGVLLAVLFWVESLATGISGGIPASRFSSSPEWRHSYGQPARTSIGTTISTGTLSFL